MNRERTHRITRFAGRSLALAAVISAASCLSPSPAYAQAQKPAAPPPPPIPLAAPPSAANAGAPLTITLAAALTRAQKNSPQFQAAVTAAELARENQVQARAAMAPSLDYQMQYLNTQGNGISPVGRFVTNDGVHVYRAWGVVRESMPGSFFLDAGPREAGYLRALAAAQQEIALRGLAVTVTQDYYALVAAQRNEAAASQALASARRFLAISEALEKGGEVAHTDVIRFQLQASQSERALEDARLAVSTARLNLAVLLFPTFSENFQVVDDLATPPAPPAFAQAEARARSRNPELAAALAAYHAAGVNVSIAKAAFFPSFAIDFDYGIEANALALHSDNLTRPGVLQPNLGYFATYSLNLPIWDWGLRRSQLHQAEDTRALERVNLSYVQRGVVAQLYSFYNQTVTAWNELGNFRRSVALAEHNLQLVTMQYKAGETTVLQVLDAENSLVLARDDYTTGAAGYRSALAQLETVTGSF